MFMPVMEVGTLHALLIHVMTWRCSMCLTERSAPLPFAALDTSAFPLLYSKPVLLKGPFQCLEKLCFQGKHGVGVHL